MRNIIIADHLLSELLQATGAISETEAVSYAIKEWLRYRKIQEIKKLRGKLSVDDNVELLRNKELAELAELNEPCTY